MAVLKSSELKYGVPFKVSVGSLYLTATQVETPASAELQGETETLELNLSKLGLSDEAIAGLAAVAGPLGEAGSTATTTALPAVAWSTPLKTAKTANEAGKIVTVAFVTDVQITNGKLALRVYGESATVKADGNPLVEPKSASKAAVGACVCTVFVLGK